MLYLAPHEIQPHRTVKNKGFILKIMFVCDVCRPDFGRDGSVLFDGKICIFPFTKEMEATRYNINKLKGTKETKQIDSITKEVIRKCFVKNVRIGTKESIFTYSILF